MLMRDALQAVRRRWSHPGLWLALCLVPACLTVPFLKGSSVPLPADFPLSTALSALSFRWVISILLVGLPVQWSGSARPQARLPRGLTQILLMEGALAAALIFIPRLWISGRPYFLYAGFVTAWFLISTWFVGLIHWLVARAETHEAELREAEQMALAVQNLARRASFSPVLLHQALERLEEEHEAEALETGLVDLAVIFRTWLWHQQASAIPFRDERELAWRHAALVRRLHAPQLELQAQWEPSADERRVPALAPTRLLERLCLVAGPRLNRVVVASRALPGGLELIFTLEGPEAVPVAMAVQGDETWATLARQAPWGLRDPGLDSITDPSTATLRATFAEVTP